VIQTYPPQPFLQALIALAEVTISAYWNNRSSARKVRENMVKMDVMTASTPIEILTTVSTFTAFCARISFVKQAIFHITPIFII
jgi:hypothetical protein